MNTTTFIVAHTVQYPFALDQMSESVDIDLTKKENCTVVKDATQKLNVGFVSNVK